VRVAHFFRADDEGLRLSMERVFDDEKVSAVHEALLMLIDKGVSASKKIQSVCAACSGV
jgi:hypothetical protein